MQFLWSVCKEEVGGGITTVIINANDSNQCLLLLPLNNLLPDINCILNFVWGLLANFSCIPRNRPLVHLGEWKLVRWAYLLPNSLTHFLSLPLSLPLLPPPPFDQLGKLLTDFVWWRLSWSCSLQSTSASAASPKFITIRKEIDKFLSCGVGDNSIYHLFCFICTPALPQSFHFVRLPISSALRALHVLKECLFNAGIFAP